MNSEMQSKQISNIADKSPQEIAKFLRDRKVGIRSLNPAVIQIAMDRAEFEALIQWILDQTRNLFSKGDES